MKQSHNILVVDDEAAHTMLISELLKRAGYSVTTANDPFKAIAACKVRTPDMIILDLHMPLMGGMDVFERLRTENRTENVPIIFLGNKDRPIPVFKTDEPQSEDILFKPFEPNELLSRVRSLLKMKALKDELRRKESELSELSLTDSLTSLRTIRYLNEFLKTGLKQAKRYNVPLSVVVLEIDHSRELVRNIGQEAADEVMAQMSEMVAKQMRDSDITVRSGNFEITVALTATDVNGAIEVAERLRSRISQTSFAGGDMEFSITVSVGICQYSKSMDDDGKMLMSHARAAVSQGHLSGGNVTLKAE
ncbi:MAG TPA: diguanylate cyclase [Planktothrix sp.]